MKTKILKQLCIAGFTLLLASCGSPAPEKIIKDCEACFGDNNTNHELKGLSKKEAAELAICLLGPIEKMRATLQKMDANEAEDYKSKLKAAMEQSDYKNILARLNYGKLKEMELEYQYESKTTEELATVYCEWASKEAAAKDANDDDAREVADVYQDAIRAFVKARSPEDEVAFDAATEGCKDH
jgi:hypothetical protein